MSRRAPVRLSREQRVSDILRAARDLLCEKGYENVAVAEIAARLGVVEGTIYKYFESKRELLHRVLEHWYEEMFGDYARDLAGIQGARARLRLLVWRHLRSVRDNPLLCRLMFREVRAGSDYKGSGLHAMNRRYTQLLMDVIREGVDSGEFRAGLPLPLLRDLVYGGIEHHCWNYIDEAAAKRGGGVSGRGSLDIDATAERITAVLCDGVTATPTAANPARELRRLSRLADRFEQALPARARGSA